MHLRTDMKDNVSVSAQQAIYFRQQHPNMHRTPSEGAGFSNDPKNCHNTPQQYKLNIDCPTDALTLNRMQSTDFTGHQTKNQKMHKHKQKLQSQAPKIKQEPRSQPQLLAANQFSYRQGAAGTPSPNDMMSVMSSSMNMNISSSPMMADSSVKAMMSQGICHESSSNANAMNQNMGNNNNAFGARRAQSSGIMNDIDMGTSVTINQNSCADMDVNDVSPLLRHNQNKLLQHQQQMCGTQLPPTQNKGNTVMTNRMIQQSNGNPEINHNHRGFM